MGKFGRSPAQGLIQHYLAGGIRQLLVTTNYMADTHKMIVKNHSEVICWQTISLHDNKSFGACHFYWPVDQISESDRFAARGPKPHHRLPAIRDQASPIFFV